MVGLIETLSARLLLTHRMSTHRHPHHHHHHQIKQSELNIPFSEVVCYLSCIIIITILIVIIIIITTTIFITSHITFIIIMTSSSSLSSSLSSLCIKQYCDHFHDGLGFFPSHIALVYVVEKALQATISLDAARTISRVLVVLARTLDNLTISAFNDMVVFFS